KCGCPLKRPRAIRDRDPHRAPNSPSQTLKPRSAMRIPSGFDSAWFGRLASRVRGSFWGLQPGMRSLYKSLILLLMALLAVGAAPSAQASVHPVHAQHAIVVSVHELASHVGVDIMQAGGNAIDAAVATGFALALVHSPAGNIG